ncbi:VTT domain-containing protein [Candidatus Uhrbacteria bacterium]|nr:VTT domain-containing protein [Candidatus Uhrbacteria bacterium]
MDLVHLIIGFGYLGITVVIFAETGLLVGFFLPGDSLLFTAGFLASQGVFDVRFLIALCAVAAIVGDSVGYAFGVRVGPRIFSREDSLLFHRDHLTRAQRFYEHHGPKAIVLARFVPFARTFVPILAGVGRMQYARFLTYNVVGGTLWAVGIPLLGYFLGRSIPGIDQYLLPIILLIIVLSVSPGIIHVLRNPQDRASIIAGIRLLLRRVFGRNGRQQ